VQDAILGVMRFWLKRGVDGFRIDALNFAMHDPQLRDNPPAPDGGSPRTRPFDFQLKTYNQSHADIPGFIRRIRALTDEFEGTFTVAEVGGDDAAREMKLFTHGEAHLNSAYSFAFLYADALTSDLVCDALSSWPDEPDFGWPSWAFENHDAPRALTRWCDPEHRDVFARMKALLLMCLRGNAILYYGEELGLTQVDIPFDQLHDPEAIANWPLTLSRDGARTPVPWDRSSTAGFGSDAPWLPVGRDNRNRAVADQVDKGDSILAATCSAIALRRAHPAIRLGSVENCRAEGAFLSFERVHDDQRVLCLINLGTETVSLDPIRGGILACINEATRDELPPYATLILEI